MKSINYRIFIFQLIAAIRIIFIHTDFQVGGYYFDALGRYGVLFFFIVSSFFYCQHLEKEHYNYKATLKRCLRLLIIEAIVLVIYIGGSLIYNIAAETNPALFSHFSIDNVIDYFTNHCSNLSFLWFINSLILCYLVFPLLWKIKYLHKKESIWVPLLVLFLCYIFRFFAGKYNFGIFSYYQSTRNFLLLGLPAFLLGQWIYEHKDSFVIYQKLSYKWFYFAIIGLLGLSVLEAFGHEQFGTRENEYYLSSIALAMLFLMYGLKSPHTVIGKGVAKVAGREIVVFVYLFHVLFMDIYSVLNVYGYMSAVKIVLTVLSLAIISIIYHQIKFLIIKKKASELA